MTEPLSFEAFQRRLAEMLDLEAAQLRPEAGFVADLGIDSLRMVEVLLRLQQEGIDIAPELAWQMQTVADAYRIYAEQAVGPGATHTPPS